MPQLGFQSNSPSRSFRHERSGKEQAVLAEALDDRQGQAASARTAAENLDRTAYVPSSLGSRTSWPSRIVDQAGKNARAKQAPSLARVQLATEKAATEPVEFAASPSCRPPRMPSSKRSGVLAGVVDAILVDDQGVWPGRRSPAGDTCRSRARAGQARGFQAEDRPGQLPSPTQCDQELEAFAVHGGVPEKSLVLIDDGDGRPWTRPSSSARCTRSYCRAVLAVCSRTWNRVDCRT